MRRSCMLFLSTVRRAVWGGSGAALAALLLLGCSGDVAPFQPKVNASADSLYWQLTLDVSAALLSTQSPYDTIRLVATPRDKNGNAITGLGPITFRSSDPGRVEVTPDGL